jgi:hypothetical protein
MDRPTVFWNVGALLFLPWHTDHSLLQLLRQRVYQVAAGYEDCNEANHLRVDPALRLTLGKEHESGAGQSALSRFENNVLATGKGLKALEDLISRSADTLLRRRNKRRLVIDVDSTEDPVHENQEGAAFNGYFEQVCRHPLFLLTNKGDLLSARLRPGNGHSADGVMDLISPGELFPRVGFILTDSHFEAVFHVPSGHPETMKRPVGWVERSATHQSFS